MIGVMPDPALSTLYKHRCLAGRSGLLQPYAIRPIDRLPFSTPEYRLPDYGVLMYEMLDNRY